MAQLRLSPEFSSHGGGNPLRSLQVYKIHKFTIYKIYKFTIYKIYKFTIQKLREKDYKKIVNVG